MPRKPKPEKQTITVLVNGTPVAVILHPPTGTRPSWYAYWNGLVASKSTGQRTSRPRPSRRHRPGGPACGIL